jgi:hypothetical protein
MSNAAVVVAAARPPPPRSLQPRRTQHHTNAAAPDHFGWYQSKYDKKVVTSEILSEFSFL